MSAMSGQASPDIIEEQKSPNHVFSAQVFNPKSEYKGEISSYKGGTGLLHSN